MEENDYIKQERVKLHYASDNIKQFLDVLEQEGKEKFAWAWEQVRRNIKAIRLCYMNNKGLCETKDEILNRYNDVHDLWEELDKKVHENQFDSSIISNEEIKKAIKGYRNLVDELNKSFKLDEFGNIFLT